MRFNIFSFKIHFFLLALFCLLENKVSPPIIIVKKRYLQVYILIIIMKMKSYKTTCRVKLFLAVATPEQCSNSLITSVLVGTYPVLDIFTLGNTMDTESGGRLQLLLNVKCNI